MFAPPEADVQIAAALAEDLGVRAEEFLDPSRAGADLLARDVTSATVVPVGAHFEGLVVARQAGVVCGLPVVLRLFEMLAEASAAEQPDCFPLVAEGANVAPGEAVLEIAGPARVVLAGERSALDFLMVLSGIATEARLWQDAAGQGLVVTDTRKTIPGLRALSKYAVRVGGAANHRDGLFDMVLIKDNHLAHTGGLRAAIAVVRSEQPGLLIEVEADTLEVAVAAAVAGADMVLLDNMDDATLARAVVAVRNAASAAGRTCLTEASGGITFERIPALLATGVDRLSTSALTLAPPLDFGLDEVIASTDGSCARPMGDSRL
jgi:nicotinate-nucleotide pyrophosphorylase (carboxylating)